MLKFLNGDTPRYIEPTNEAKLYPKFTSPDIDLGFREMHSAP